MGDVVDFTGMTKLPIDPDKVLSAAIGELDSVVIIGWDKDDDLWFSISHSEKEGILYLLESAKKNLMDN